MKSKVIQYAKKHNLEIEIVYDYQDLRKIDEIMIDTPDGYRFNDDLHGLCYPNLVLYDCSAKKHWEFIYKDLIQFSIDKCPSDCVCKE